MEHSLAQPVKRIGDLFASIFWRGMLGGYFLLLAGIVWFIKSSYLPALWLDPVFGLYSLCVTVYLLSRFSLSLLYHPVRRGPDELPTVAVVIPAMNEQAAIETTLTSIFALDYPQHLLSVFAVDDGSTDATWERMAFAARRFPNLHAIRFSHNRGKRAAMAAGIRATKAQIICFVDSDSALEPDAPRAILKPFRARRAAAGTCASGCFSAYRRDRLLEVLPAWETQSFLGREATFGDDRALTNMLLKRSRVVYQSTARCATNVPHTFKAFLVQQTRWKKSWLRESLIASTFFWRKNPVASIPTYASNVFPIVAPVVIFHACIWNPLVHGADPWMYLVGLYAMAVLYSLYYGFTRRKPYWWAGIAFVLLYATVLIWQTYWAIATARKTAWGTGSGRVDDGLGFRIIGTIGSPQPSGIPLCDEVERIGAETGNELGVAA